MSRRSIREKKREAEAWAAFRQEVTSLQSMAEAQRLIESRPSGLMPGWTFYLHLEYFLKDFSIPVNMSVEERLMYADFVSRLAASGEISQISALNTLQVIAATIAVFPSPLGAS